MTKEFEKKFWDEALKDPFALIVGGTCLHIGASNVAFKGFGGAKFMFKIIEDTSAYKKGIIIYTDNVWYRGDVPDWCNTKNNAIIIEDSPTKIITKETRNEN
jgi:hypothetical protein